MITLPENTRLLEGTKPILGHFEIETDLQGHNDAALRDLTIRHRTAAYRAKKAGDEARTEKHCRQIGIYLSEIQDRFEGDEQAFERWCRKVFIGPSEACQLMASTRLRDTECPLVAFGHLPLR